MDIWSLDLGKSRTELSVRKFINIALKAGVVWNWTFCLVLRFIAGLSTAFQPNCSTRILGLIYALYHFPVNGKGNKSCPSEPSQVSSGSRKEQIMWANPFLCQTYKMNLPKQSVQRTQSVSGLQCFHQHSPWTHCERRKNKTLAGTCASVANVTKGFMKDHLEVHGMRVKMPHSSTNHIRLKKGKSWTD